MIITVAGMRYVRLSLTVLLAQHHEVTAITTTEKKAEKLNSSSALFRMMRLSGSFRKRMMANVS